MSISKEMVDSANAYRLRKRGDIETYARLEWGGHLGSLELRSRSSRQRSDWLQRFRVWVRRPTREDHAVPTRASPVVVHRVRIGPELELLVSLAAPALAAETGFPNAPRDPGPPIPADFVLGERP